ncbi:MAG TPA: hypothetical protein VK803_02805 [Steroidobacteraceae bacterium]|nr:hypothetical protein [Steroidobacteraceae bacterium]
MPASSDDDAAQRKSTPPLRTTQAVLLSVAACGLALGTFARLKSPGAAPLAVDEYFIVRSTQNLLRHGWPAFDCGGSYTRGLLLQYLTAPLSLVGVSWESAPRIVSAICSLLGLPAVFVVGRRVGGPAVGLLALTVIALSVWETEMARFGRMYAPFQAVFLWYLVFFLRRTVDRDSRAAVPMVILTIIGALLWEGGVLLALANLLPVLLQRRSLRLSKAEWRGMLLHFALFVVLYAFVTTDFRALGGTAALPLDYDSAAPDPAAAVPSLWAALLGSRVWLALSLIPVAASVAALRTLWLRRADYLPALGLTAALLAALAHQFLAAAAVLLLMCLLRFIPWSQLASHRARGIYAAIGVWAVFWLSLAWASWHPPAVGLFANELLAFLDPLVSVPDFVNQVARPWAGAVPMLGAGLLLLLGVAVIRVLRRDEPGVSDERAVLVVVICLLLAACASHPPRHETRYVFFLYPAVIVVAISVLAALAREIARRRRIPADALTALLCLGAFALSEDFQPRHLLQIDRAATIFKPGLPPAQQSHLVVRDDTRALAQWLHRHAAADGTVVISAFQSLDYYDPQVDFFYVDRSDFNFASYACRSGTLDRWSNRPLLQSVPAVETVITANPRTYLVTYSSRIEPLRSRLARYDPRVELSVGHLAVMTFGAGTAGAARPR